jgi:hypothetical protein
VDDPDVAVCPANHENFISLAPGESWTFSNSIYIQGSRGGLVGLGRR